MQPRNASCTSSAIMGAAEQSRVAWAKPCSRCQQYQRSAGRWYALECGPPAMHTAANPTPDGRERAVAQDLRALVEARN